MRREQPSTTDSGRAGADGVSQGLLFEQHESFPRAWAKALRRERRAMGRQTDQQADGPMEWLPGFSGLAVLPPPRPEHFTTPPWEGPSEF